MLARPSRPSLGCTRLKHGVFVRGDLCVYNTLVEWCWGIVVVSAGSLNCAVSAFAGLVMRVTTAFDTCRFIYTPLGSAGGLKYFVIISNCTVLT